MINSKFKYTKFVNFRLSDPTEDRQGWGDVIGARALSDRDIPAHGPVLGAQSSGSTHLRRLESAPQ